MKAKIPQWTAEAETDLPDNTGGQWGFVKHKVGEFSREYGAKIKKVKMLLKANLEKDIKIPHSNLNETNKEQYRNLQDHKNCGI